MRSPFSPRHTRALLVGAVALSLVGVGCGGASDSNEPAADGGNATTVDLVAYSTPKVVYDELIPGFAKTTAGRDTKIRPSFGASGEQSRAVAAGQKADVVSFSVEPDVTRLVKAGLVDENWAQGATQGRVNTSLVSFIVREGNPKNIRSWNDLLRPGIEVLTPNPLTSGAAKWNLLAAYGQASRGAGGPKAGLDYVRRLLTERVKIQDKSGREALQNFLSGRGDVLLSYEYEAITAQKEGETLDLVIPDDTIRIDINIATTKKASRQAQAFVDYVLSPAGQAVFADWGYRPVNPEVLAANRERFPDPSGLFTIGDLGGWEKVDEELFDPQSGAISQIENER